MDRGPAGGFWRLENSNHYSTHSHPLWARMWHYGHLWWKPDWPWRGLISKDRTWLPTSTLCRQIVDRYRETMLPDRMGGVSSRIHHQKAAHVFNWSTALSGSHWQQAAPPTVQQTQRKNTSQNRANSDEDAEPRLLYNSHTWKVQQDWLNLPTAIARGREDRPWATHQSSYWSRSCGSHGNY